MPDSQAPASHHTQMCKNLRGEWACSIFIGDYSYGRGVLYTLLKRKEKEGTAHQITRLGHSIGQCRFFSWWFLPHSQLCRDPRTQGSVIEKRDCCLQLSWISFLQRFEERILSGWLRWLLCPKESLTIAPGCPGKQGSDRKSLGPACCHSVCVYNHRQPASNTNHHRKTRSHH